MRNFKIGFVLALLSGILSLTTVATPAIARFIKMKKHDYEAKQDFNLEVGNFVEGCVAFTEKVNEDDIDLERLNRLENDIIDLEEKLVVIENLEVVKNGLDSRGLIVKGNELVHSFWVLLGELQQGNDNEEVGEAVEVKIDEVNVVVQKFSQDLLKEFWCLKF